MHRETNPLTGGLSNEEENFTRKATRYCIAQEEDQLGINPMWISDENDLNDVWNYSS